MKSFRCADEICNSGNLEIWLKSANILQNHNLGYHKISLIAREYRLVDECAKIQTLKKDLFANTPTIRTLQIQFEYPENL
jgi:hypothetical protein